MNYDIYLRDVCHTVPDLENLSKEIPALRAAEVQAKLTSYPPAPENSWEAQEQPPRPGFLGLNVAEGKARELYRQLHAAQAQGEVLPASYRDPQITKEQALKIAELKIMRVHEERFPTQHFSPVRLYKDTPRWWVFSAAIKELLDAPVEDLRAGAGGPMVYVDKVDGHIVESGERQALAKKNRE